MTKEAFRDVIANAVNDAREDLDPDWVVMQLFAAALQVASLAKAPRCDVQHLANTIIAMKYAS